MDESLDEKIFCMMSLSEDSNRLDNIEAMGLRLKDNNEDYLVGIYLFWEKYRNPKKFLKSMTNYFGEAHLHKLPGENDPGLICRMNCKGPDQYVGILKKDSRHYDKIRLHLLDMKGRFPKPLLSLKYNLRKNRWDYKPVLNFNDENVYDLDQFRKYGK